MAAIPSARNFDIYYAVEDRQMSLREAAALYDVSPQRVQQIVAQVEHWYRASTPQWVAEGDFLTRSLVAFRRHDERCKHLYDRAMRSFEASIGDHSTSEVKVADPRSAVSRHCVKHGDPTYLAAALRISRERFLATAALAKLVEHVDLAPAINSPPIGVLAQETAEMLPAAEEDAERFDATDYQSEGCDDGHRSPAESMDGG